MLDNKFDKHTDKAFAKQSWKKMNELLNRDLPVQKQKANKTVVILSFLLFFSCIISAYLFYKTNKNHTPAFAEVTKETISYRNIYHNTAPIQSESNLILPKSIIKNQNKSSYLDQKSTTSNINIVKSPINSFNERIQNAVSTTNTNLIENTNVESKDLGLSFERMIPLLNISFAPINLSNKNKKPRSFKYNLSLLASLVNNFDFSGYGINSGFQFPISRKLSINVGLAYNEFSRGQNFFPFLTSERVKPITTIVTEKPDVVDQGDFYAGILEVKQFVMPLKVNYDINKFFSVSSGFNLRHTFSRTLDSPIAEINHERERTIERRKFGKLKGNDAPASYFNDTNFGLSAGVNFNVSEKFSLSLDTEWGLGSMFNTEAFAPNSTGQNQYLNLINLSTNYSF